MECLQTLINALSIIWDFLNSNFLLFCGAMWVGYKQLSITNKQNKIQEYIVQIESKQFIINGLMLEIQNNRDNIIHLNEKIESKKALEGTKEYDNIIHVIKINERAMFENKERAKAGIEELKNMPFPSD